MVDRYLLRYFLAIIDQGNFSRAATYCNVSQPTLSVGIAKLERTLGVALFVRSNQRVELTEAGARFQAHARKIEREFNVALQSMRQASDRRSLRVGVLDSLASDAVAAAVSRSASDLELRFELVFGAERDLTAHLAKRRIDLAVTIMRSSDSKFVEEPIVSEGYGLALPADHRLADRDEIAAEELADEVMIVRRHCEALSDTSRHFTERGVRPHFAMRVTNDERTLKMVGAGLGLTVMPDFHRAPNVARRILSGFSQKRTLGWIAPVESAHLISRPPRFVEALTAELVRSGAAAGKLATP